MVKSILLRILKSVCVAGISYHICKKVFPEKKLVEPIFLDQPILDEIEPVPRGGNFAQETAKRLIQDRAFKLAMALATAYFGYDMFKDEIVALLSSDKLIQDCLKGKIKTEVCEIVKQLDLKDLKDNVRELLIKENLTRDQKITLLKIKLDAIFNAEYPNKKVALIAVLTAIMASVILVGPYGVMIFLAAVYQLWKEGKISYAVYKKMTEEAMKHLI